MRHQMMEAIRIIQFYLLCFFERNSILTVSGMETHIRGYFCSWLQVLVADMSSTLFIMYLCKGLVILCLVRAAAKLGHDKKFARAKQDENQC